jgi:hypothetical protein
MSPFTNTPELWLTAHLHRLRCEEHVVKIQAVVRGFLLRRRQAKKQSAESVIDDVIRRLLLPKDTSVVGLMRNLGLDIWANNLPTAEEAISNPEASERRRQALWHAGISLRLNGQGHHLKDLEWADYHERSLALSASKPPPDIFSPRHGSTPLPTTPPSSLWSRILKSIWGS